MLQVLAVNLAKSKLFGIGVDSNVFKDVAESIHCSFGKLPFQYLGLPVGKDMSKKEGCNEVVDRFVARLSSWKAKLLSIGGRLTLVKAIGKKM